MRGSWRALTAAGISALLLGGCEATRPFGLAPAADPVTTGSVDPVEAALTGTDALDPVSQGKRYYREKNYGLAEQAFRKAAELGPRDVDAWVGLAASYDRLKRFDLADRAYAQALRITGPTAAILNNQGFSYLLRGDLPTARKKLLAAKALDPSNLTVDANLELLEASRRYAKDVR